MNWSNLNFVFPRKCTIFTPICCRSQRGSITPRGFDWCDISLFLTPDDSQKCVCAWACDRKRYKDINVQGEVYQFPSQLSDDMHDFALFFVTEAHSVAKVWCVSLRLALLLVLAGCHSGSSFPACFFRAESYPQGNSHGQTECFTHSFPPLPSFCLGFLFSGPTGMHHHSYFLLSSLLLNTLSP